MLNISRDIFYVYKYILGCAISLLIIPSVPQAAEMQPRGLFSERHRLATLGERLSRANATECSNHQMVTGLTFHDLGAYAAADRALAAVAFDLSYGFGVRDVVEDSSGASAGLAVGDEIVSLNGIDLKTFAVRAIRTRASYERTERFVDTLDNALRKGPVDLIVRRGDGTRRLSLTGNYGCGGYIVLKSNSQVNAWSDGKYVAITKKMIEFASDDDELAFVIAHEMAHNILKHADRLGSVSSLLAQFGIGAGRIKKTEIEADALAIRLVDNAGYDVTAAERVIKRTSKLIPLDLGLTHPRVSRRVEIVNAEIDRLRARNILAVVKD